MSPRLRTAARRSSGSFSFRAASTRRPESPARKKDCRISRFYVGRSFGLIQLLQLIDAVNQP